MIKAGKKGTRISSVASDIPKSMIKIEGFGFSLGKSLQDNRMKPVHVNPHHVKHPKKTCYFRIPKISYLRTRYRKMSITVAHLSENNQ